MLFELWIIGVTGRLGIATTMEAAIAWTNIPDHCATPLLDLLLEAA